MSKAFINPGHCPGIDPGAIGANGLEEANVALNIGNWLKDCLEAAGVEVEMMQDDSLEKICSAANASGANIFISLHCNASENPQAHGTEIYTSRGETAADYLATCIMRQYSNTFPDIWVRSDYTDGDIDKEAGFYVLNNTNMPAVLFEIAFISNDFEEKFLSSTLNQKEIARAIARGITDYLQNML